MAHLDLLAGVLAPVFVIFPFHFFPFALALQPSLSSSSLSEDHSLFLYISRIDPPFPSLLSSVFFASCGSSGSPFIFSLSLPGSLHSFSSSLHIVSAISLSCDRRYMSEGPSRSTVTETQSMVGVGTAGND